MNYRNCLNNLKLKSVITVYPVPKVFIMKHGHEADYKVFFVNYEHKQKNHQIILVMMRNKFTAFRRIRNRLHKQVAGKDIRYNNPNSRLIEYDHVLFPINISVKY
ncbi:MAG: hypothetical protein C0417_03875 [Chlorobiaceae bacterium]|nr:hypothetical protein [Chlorobiaceae bacterium]